MADITIAEWLPKDPELVPFYKGIYDFVQQHVNLKNPKIYEKGKVVIDPCVGYIELFHWEVTLLDTQVFQQLRHITQLGLAYLVFPTLRYSRFEHTIGVLGRLDQMIKKLREKHKGEKDMDILTLIAEYETSVRLAALFHDVGHCLFSHLSESVISELPGEENYPFNNPNYYPSVRLIKQKFNEKFNLGKGNLSIAEIFSIIMMSAPAFTSILELGKIQSRIGVSNHSVTHADYIPRLLMSAARFIAGVPVENEPKTVLMAQLISSGLDADKLDYMSREEHFSGIKIEMDLDRILNKIKVQRVQSNKGLQKGLEKYTRHITDSNEPYYLLCIERGGQFAYEEFCVARLALYEKIYLHKKVRAAEQNLKNKFEKLYSKSAPLKKAHNWLYLPESIIENETKIVFVENERVIIKTEVTLFGEEHETEDKKVIKEQPQEIDLSFIQKRELPHRAYAFGPANATFETDYYSLLDSARTQKDVEEQIGGMLSVRFWDKLKQEDDALKFIEGLEKELKELINFLREVKPSFKDALNQLETSIDNGQFRNDIIIDIPDYKRVVLSFENLYFEESSFQLVRWTIPIHRISHYYQLHRILAYIYYEKKYCDLINIAAEKVVLNFFGSELGQRQVYDQKTFIAKEVIEKTNALKTDILKSWPQYYRGYKELTPTKKSLQNEYTIEMANRIASELSYYYNNKFSKRVSHQDVINYVRQFPEELQDFMLEVLNCIRVVHDTELKPALESLFQYIKQKSPDDKINLVPLGTAFSSASGMIKHYASTLRKYGIQINNLDAPKISEFNHFVFIDDNTNSGRQAFNIMAKWCGLTEEQLGLLYTDVEENGDASFMGQKVVDILQSANTKLTFCFITGTQDGKNFLEKNLRQKCGIKGDISIEIKYELKKEYGIFHKNTQPDKQNIFSNINEDFAQFRDSQSGKLVNKARDFLKEIGAELVKGRQIHLKQFEQPSDHALGYCNRESLVIFPNSVPTSTLTALWCRGKYKLNGADAEELDWIPLIPRE